MSDLLDTAARFRRELLDKDARAAAEMIRAYGAAYAQIRAALDDLLARMAQEPHPVSVGWLYREKRLSALLAQILVEIHRFARSAEDAITDAQRLAVYNAADNALALIQASAALSAGSGLTATFARLPAGAAEHLVGTLQDGSPLRSLLDELAEDAAARARTVLVSGVAAGRNPHYISREMRKSLGVNLTRALTSSRTETLRAYREASLETYRANADLVEGWVWVASLSRRTCGMCLAMHGTWHPLDEPFGSHPNCRCVPVPETRPAEGGASRSRQTSIQSGADWFADQEEATQLAILGPAKLAAYRAGRISLPDLVQYHDDPKWGPGRSEKSLKTALH